MLRALAALALGSLVAGPAAADGAANHGFLLLPETTNGGDLATTDASDPALRPRLVVELANVVSVPEPATLALLGLAATAAARGRGWRGPRCRRRSGRPCR